MGKSGLELRKRFKSLGYGIQEWKTDSLQKDDRLVRNPREEAT